MAPTSDLEQAVLDRDAQWAKAFGFVKSEDVIDGELIRFLDPAFAAACAAIRQNYLIDQMREDCAAIIESRQRAQESGTMTWFRRRYKTDKAHEAILGHQGER